MRKNFIKGLALGMAVCMGVVGCGSNSSSDAGTTTTAGGEEQTTTVAGSDEETTTEGEVDYFPAYDFDGVTLTLLDTNDFSGKNPANTEDEFVKEERQANIDRIQEKYNVVLEFVAAPGANWEEMAQELISAYTAGQPVADVMDLYYNWMAPLMANGVIYDMTEIFDSSDTYKEMNVLEFLDAKWGICSSISGEGLYYNADMIEAAGMEYTPAEMFDMGMWDYDNFYNYCVKMKAGLAEDEYPLFVAPYYWALFASAANGTRILDPVTFELNYLDQEFLDVMEFLQKLVNEGLAAIPDQNENGGYNNWGYPGSTFDAGVTVAMSHRAAWQAAGLVDKFTLGYAPYPWGPNVTVDADMVGKPGAYLTLSENYEGSYFDGQVITFVETIEEKADPEQLMSMMCDFMGWSWMLTANEEASDLRCGWLEKDSIDNALYAFCREREACEFYDPMSELFDTSDLAWSGTIYQNLGVRSAFESAYNSHMAQLKELGYVKDAE